MPQCMSGQMSGRLDAVQAFRANRRCSLVAAAAAAEAPAAAAAEAAAEPPPDPSRQSSALGHFQQMHSTELGNEEARATSSIAT